MRRCRAAVRKYKTKIGTRYPGGSNSPGYERVFQRIRINIKSVKFYPEDGAGERSRTPDLRITNALLYRLSYTGGKGFQARLRTRIMISTPSASVPSGNVGS